MMYYFEETQGSVVPKCQEETGFLTRQEESTMPNADETQRDVRTEQISFRFSIPVDVDDCKSQRW